MYGEIGEIESLAGIKNVLIIDNEVEFCRLMRFYLTKKNINVNASCNLVDALIKIETEKPDLIITDRTFHPNVQNSVTEKINSITGYSPKIYFISTYLAEREGSFTYTLKRDYYKKNYNKTPRNFWEEIIQYLKDLFR